MQPVGKELLYVGYFQRYVEHGHQSIILYFFGGLINGENCASDIWGTFDSFLVDFFIGSFSPSMISED